MVAFSLLFPSFVPYLFFRGLFFKGRRKKKFQGAMGRAAGGG
jgi:hypothetical protein